VFHIGEDVNYKTFTFRFKDLLGKDLSITRDGQILLDAEVSSVFGNPHPVKFRATNDVSSVSQGSQLIADNYKRAFFKLVGAQ
jgi:hypothetical protein